MCCKQCDSCHGLCVIGNDEAKRIQKLLVAIASTSTVKEGL